MASMGHHLVGFSRCMQPPGSSCPQHLLWSKLIAATNAWAPWCSSPLGPRWVLLWPVEQPLPPQMRIHGNSPWNPWKLWCNTGSVSFFWGGRSIYGCRPGVFISAGWDEFTTCVDLNPSCSKRAPRSTGAMHGFHLGPVWYCIDNYR